MTTNESTRCWREVESCPACAGSDFDIVGGQARGFPSDERVNLNHPPYAIHACLNCALHYKSRVLNDPGLTTYYQALDFTPFDSCDTFPTDAAIIKMLRGLPSGARILDYGCSTGRILAKLGTGYCRYGIEINDAAAQEARLRGITILTDAAVDDENLAPFDAIILADVYEHLVRPTETLRRLAGKLNSGGMMLIVTGLSDAVRPKELLAEYWYMRITGHLHMISRDHVLWLADALNLVPGQLEEMCHYRPDLWKRIRQETKAALYSILRLSPDSIKAAVIKVTPGLSRAARWTNCPAIDQRADHVLVSFIKAKMD